MHAPLLTTAALGMSNAKYLYWRTVTPATWRGGGEVWGGRGMRCSDSGSDSDSGSGGGCPAHLRDAVVEEDVGARRRDDREEGCRVALWGRQ